VKNREGRGKALMAHKWLDQVITRRQSSNNSSSLELPFREEPFSGSFSQFSTNVPFSFPLRGRDWEFQLRTSDGNYLVGMLGLKPELFPGF
jgi:hypothetical protein